MNQNWKIFSYDGGDFGIISDKNSCFNSGGKLDKNTRCLSTAEYYSNFKPPYVYPNYKIHKKCHDCVVEYEHKLKIRGEYDDYIKNLQVE